MTDTGIRYTHCRGPHCGGRKLAIEDEFLDGLCFDPNDRPCCYARCWKWYEKRHGRIHLAIASPEWSVAIDQWLEAGAP